MLKTSRYHVIDCIRGYAIIAMIAYHFGFDLNMQGYISQDINHNSNWQVARSLILGNLSQGLVWPLQSIKTLRYD